MSKFYKGLKEGLEEALAHSQGKITLKSESIQIPEPPSVISIGFEDQCTIHNENR